MLCFCDSGQDVGFRLFHHTSCLRLHLYHLRCNGETATKLTNIELLQHFNRARAEKKVSLQKNAGRAEFQVRLPDSSQSHVCHSPL